MNGSGAPKGNTNRRKWSNSTPKTTSKPINPKKVLNTETKEDDNICDEEPFHFKMHQQQQELEEALAGIIHSLVNNPSNINPVTMIKNLFESKYDQYGKDSFDCIETIIFGKKPDDFNKIKRNCQLYLELEFFKLIQQKNEDKKPTKEDYIKGYAKDGCIWKLLYISLRCGAIESCIKLAIDHMDKLGDNRQDIIKLLINLTKKGSDNTINYNPYMPIHLDNPYMILIYFLLGIYGKIEWKWYKKRLFETIFYAEQHYQWFKLAMLNYNNNNDNNKELLMMMNNLNEFDGDEQFKMDIIQKLLVTQQFGKAINILLERKKLVGIHMAVIMDYHGLWIMPPDWSPFLEWIHYLSSSSTLQPYIFDYCFICDIFALITFLVDPKFKQLHELLVGTLNQESIKKSLIYRHCGPLKYANICSISAQTACENGEYDLSIYLFILSGESNAVHMVYKKKIASTIPSIPSKPPIIPSISSIPATIPVIPSKPPIIPSIPSIPATIPSSIPPSMPSIQAPPYSYSYLPSSMPSIPAPPYSYSYLPSYVPYSSLSPYSYLSTGISTYPRHHQAISNNKRNKSKKKKKEKKCLYNELISQYEPIHNHPMDGHKNETLVKSIYFKHIYHYDFDNKKWNIRCTKNKLHFYKNGENNKIRIIARENGTQKIRINQYIYKNAKLTQRKKNVTEWQWLSLDSTICDKVNFGFFAIRFETNLDGILFKQYFKNAMNVNNLLPMMSSSTPSIQIDLTNYSK